MTHELYGKALKNKILSLGPIMTSSSLFHSDPTIAYVLSQVGQCPGVKRVILFGSRANATFHARSDYDLAIEWDPSFSDSVWAILCEKLREDNPSLNPLDIVRLDQAGLDFKQRILDQGKVIYDKTQTKI